MWRLLIKLRWFEFNAVRQKRRIQPQRPPSAPVSAALDAIQDQLARVNSTGKPVYLLGDLNFDLQQPSKPEVKRYQQTLQDLGMKQLVSGPTRPESGSLIDHVVVRATDDVTTARVVPSSCSDHDLVVAETRLKRERSRPAEITVRSTRGLVPDQLRLELLLADWAAVYGATSTEEKWAAWLAVWTPVVDRHMPVVKRRRRAAASSDDDRLAAFARDLSDSWYSDLPPKLDAGGVSTSNANKKSTFIRLFSHRVKRTTPRGRPANSNERSEGHTGVRSSGDIDTSGMPPSGIDNPAFRPTFR
ncbi:hypothetical protein FJT64_006754 [Amphibalanus amphitrite]|uniref:Endonuclease/exonuclease/phosphatase domain-containing protein n=1 Tax=Amphibalanus amphitrite TaxID=1232801 RepID=A0A6A4VY33_AMPAM|nr:hypothetical protein FJT64_006754 [Amphibalanus amphitrite]